MFGPMERLIYFSRSRLHGPRWQVEREISSLVAGARIRNAYWRITGALLFSEDCFVQILEGEADDLSWLFQAITADPRHCDVTLLQRVAIAERGFPDSAIRYVATESLRPPSGARTGETLFHRLTWLARGGA